MRPQHCSPVIVSNSLQDPCLANIGMMHILLWSGLDSGTPLNIRFLDKQVNELCMIGKGFQPQHVQVHQNCGPSSCTQMRKALLHDPLEQFQ